MKSRLVQGAAAVAGALAPWMAAASPLTARLVAEQPSVLLLKARGDHLRFRWAARVGASGQFVLLGPDGSEMWTAAVVGRRAYEVAPPALSGEYELRYRDSSGRQHVLAHVLVACASIEHHAPMVSARPAPPNADVAGAVPRPAASATDAVMDAPPGGLSPPLGPPPTPPPRPRA